MKLTKRERAALKLLNDLTDVWPKSLTLFSAAGTLVVIKKDADGAEVVVEATLKIPNDGGDPLIYVDADGRRIMDRT